MIISAHLLGTVLFYVFLDGFISGVPVNLGYGYDPGCVVKLSGFLGNICVASEYI